MQSSVIHTDTLQFVTFKLAGQKYAVDILQVQEINNMREITTIPNAPSFLLGAINLRGKVIPVINLRNKFSMPNTESIDAAKIVITDIRGLVAGIMVDSVSDVLRIPQSVVEPPPQISLNAASDYITGIANLETGLIIILDSDKLLGLEEYNAVHAI
jgi:purine-binding chemotaxis protein CheW